MEWGKSGVALRLDHRTPKHAWPSGRSELSAPATGVGELVLRARSSARMKTTFGLLEAPRAGVERKKAAMVRIDFDMVCAMSTAENGCRPLTSGA
jgi:hypothetical protein